ncbi:MAG: Uma2 family endonuclease [Acidobacteriota bacterium]
MQFVLDQLGSPLRVTPPEPLSVEAFWQVSAENPNLRLERESNGDLIVMTPTSRDTSFRNSEINFELALWARQDGRGYAFESNAGYLLPDGSILSPDASWISSNRWKPNSGEGYTTILAPDFVIELRSKSDRLPPLQQKMQTWITNGVQLAWLIDPERKTVEIYRPNQPHPDIQEGHTAVYGESPVGGFILELSRIWQ